MTQAQMPESQSIIERQRCECSLPHDTEKGWFPMRPKYTLEQQFAAFWARVEKTETCWLWRGTSIRNGYGQLSWHAPMRLAHRYAYELLVGPIPEGLTLDHLCRVRHCVNPAHLEPVTNRVNLLRGETFVAREAAQTHCPQGHPYDLFNTYTQPSRRIRYCRECRRASVRKWRAARKQAASAQGLYSVHARP